MNPEFQVHILTTEGVEKAQKIAAIFDGALNDLKAVCPEGRGLSIVKTKLEEASFFAKKAMASDPANQRQPDSIGIADLLPTEPSNSEAAASEAA